MSTLETQFLRDEVDCDCATFATIVARLSQFNHALVECSAWETCDDVHHLTADGRLRKAQDTCVCDGLATAASDVARTIPAVGVLAGSRRPGSNRDQPLEFLLAS